MKNIIALVFSLFISFSFLSAQEKNTSKIKTETIEVSGTCGMCKKRIEKAAYVNGVKRVEWHKESKKLEVTYNSKVVSLEDISKKIAAAGHDANGIHADETVYNKLPNCCAYRSGDICTH